MVMTLTLMMVLTLPFVIEKILTVTFCRVTEEILEGRMIDENKTDNRLSSFDSQDSFHSIFFFLVFSLSFLPKQFCSFLLKKVSDFMSFVGSLENCLTFCIGTQKISGRVNGFFFVMSCDVEGKKRKRST